MKVVVIGANGQLGTDLVLTHGDFEVIPLTHNDVEITDIGSIKTAFEKHKPDVIVNTAAYVRADDCEDNIDKAFLIHALGARNLAVYAQSHDAKLVHISSDYVFGGEEAICTTPYTEYDTPVPANVYGRSKLAGEEYIKHLCNRYFIVRTSALYGIAGSSTKGGNFVDTIRKIAKEKSELRVVDDQVTSPTYTKDLAEKLVQLMNTEYYGIFHITNRGHCSWYQFARQILEQTGIKTPIIPIKSDEYPQRARRPHFSVLDNYNLKLLGMDDMRPWQEALEAYLIQKGYLKHQ
jgi:dTDP-4-dehydrorhamnose reductase